MQCIHLEVGFDSPAKYSQHSQGWHSRLQFCYITIKIECSIFPILLVYPKIHQVCVIVMLNQFPSLQPLLSILLFISPQKHMYYCTENPPGMNHPGEWNRNGRYGGSEKDRIPFEEVFVTTSDGVRLHLWLLLQDETVGKTSSGSRPPPTLIYFHGNAGNMGFRLKNAAKMFARAGINVLMMDYRGYGESLSQCRYP